MKCKPSPARCRKHAATRPQPVCRKCRLVQRRYLRLGRVVKPGPTLLPVEVTEAVHTTLVAIWEVLPERSKRTLSVNIAAGRQGEEAALTDLARLLMDCAGMLFKRALTARHNRLRE